MTTMKALIATVLSTTAIFAAANAQAATYQFVVTDPSLTQSGVPLDGNRYTFFFDSAPTPVSFDAGSFTLNGSASYTAGVFGAYRVDGPFTFYTASNFGGFDSPLNIYFSDQLFTGTTAAPVFRLGTFALDSGSITISAVTSSVPEPATWGLMIVGFGMIGAASRRRRVKTTVTYA